MTYFFIVEVQVRDKKTKTENDGKTAELIMRDIQEVCDGMTFQNF